MAKGPLGDNWDYLNSIIGVKTQKKQRPKIESIIDHLITIPEMKENLLGIVGLLRDNNAKPEWFTTSHYRFMRDKERVAQIKMGDGFKFRENEIFFVIYTASPIDIKRFKELLAEDLRGLISGDFKKCRNTACKNNIDFELEGTQYTGICAVDQAVDILITTDTEDIAAQFQTIDKLIRAKIEYER
jgi:hypothetical protein